jgi:hypothetical protein
VKKKDSGARELHGPQTNIREQKRYWQDSEGRSKKTERQEMNQERNKAEEKEQHGECKRRHRDMGVDATKVHGDMKRRGGKEKPGEKIRVWKGIPIMSGYLGGRGGRSGISHYWDVPLRKKSEQTKKL